MIINLLSCCNSQTDTQKGVKTETVIDDKQDTSDSDKLIIDNMEIDTFQNNSIFASTLDKFYDTSDYYISLYYRTEYNETVANEITTKNVREITSGLEETRLQIDNNLAKRHLLVDNLDTLLIFNDKQELIDTIYRKDYEYYDAMTTSELIATYSGKDNYENNLVISCNYSDKYVIKKTPDFIIDSNYIDLIIKKLQLEKKFVFGSGFTIINNDTISFISYSDYQTNDTKVYILKNSDLINSITKDFIIRDLQPVPLYDNDKLIYLGFANVPETDIEWTALIGIDKNTLRIKFYDRNRIE
ncbi:hypothetical protein [Maribellus maritimus]|uniref:hypothetical protein n=1 Tax=Maribellus maritimus TaxID=2870838 RepID=UPI001EEC04F7|nr:hypothetical protein [Maribellus maritimus]MCG6191566.1 hypothetical protein [Maribellus maritimus]